MKSPFFFTKTCLTSATLALVLATGLAQVKDLSNPAQPLPIHAIHSAKGTPSPGDGQLGLQHQAVLQTLLTSLQSMDTQLQAINSKLTQLILSHSRTDFNSQEGFMVLMKAFKQSPGYRQALANALLHPTPKHLSAFLDAQHALDRQTLLAESSASTKAPSSSRLTPLDGRVLLNTVIQPLPLRNALATALLDPTQANIIELIKAQQAFVKQAQLKDMQLNSLPLPSFHESAGTTYWQQKGPVKQKAKPKPAESANVTEDPLKGFYQEAAD